MKIHNETIRPILFLQAFLLTACSVQEVIVDEPLSTDIILTARTSVRDEVKSSLSGTDILWSADDRIKVFNTNSEGGVIFTISDGAGTSRAYFTGKLKLDGKEVYALYPGDGIEGSLKDKQFNISLPSSQAYINGSFADNMFCSIAVGNPEKDLLFRNVFGVLKLIVKGSKSLSRISIRNDSGKKIWGDGVVELSSENIPDFKFNENGTGGNILNMTFRDPVLLDDLGKEFCFIVPSGSFDKGLSVSINDTEGGCMKLTASGDKNLMERNELKTMPILEYSGDSRPFLDSENDFGIYELSDFEDTPVLTYSPESKMQYGFICSGNTNTLRIQNWFGKAYSVQMSYPSGVSMNQITEVKVNVLGLFTGVESDNYEVKLIKAENGKLWFMGIEKGFIVKE